MQRKNNTLVTLVLPCFNEAEVLPSLVEALQKLMHDLAKQYSFEVIFVNDGSTDETIQVLESLEVVFPHITVTLSRNFGHQAALYAGMSQATGNVVITLDADLQHPPSLIKDLLHKHDEGADIVQTKRIDTKTTSLAKKATSSLFYAILNRLSHTPITTSSSDYRLLSRQVVDCILALPEQRVFLRGLIHWVGFKIVTVEFRANDRLVGKSKYTWIKMMRLALDGITSFTSLPLYFAALVGAIFSFFTVAYALYVLYIWIWGVGIVEGWSSVILVVLATGSVMSFLFALIGIYLATLFEEIKHRPLFIIKQVSR
ncbi:MAG: glycosyltransferase family 2 protein [bacterium]|nr:glycosyltransferase family 2 protein [bacterium]